jgi:hypothetical protein
MPLTPLPCDLPFPLCALPPGALLTIDSALRLQAIPLCHVPPLFFSLPLDADLVVVVVVVVLVVLAAAVLALLLLVPLSKLESARFTA